MKIEARVERGVTVIEPRGWITMGEGSAELRDMVVDTLESGGRDLVVDLGLVTGMDSSGLGELVSAHNTVGGRGGRLALANLPPKVTDILQATKLITVFEAYGTVDEALASFR